MLVKFINLSVLMLFPFLANAMDDEKYITAEEKQSLFVELGLTYCPTNCYHEKFNYPDLRRYPSFSPFLAPLHSRISKSKALVGRWVASLEKGLRISEKVCTSASRTLEPLKFRDDLGIIKSLGVTGFVLHFFDDDYASNTYIGKVKAINGYGAFANRKILANQIIGELTGKVVYALASQTGNYLWLGDKEEMTCEDSNDDKGSGYIVGFLEQHPQFIFNLQFRAQFRDSLKLPLVIESVTHRNEISFINHSQKFANAKMAKALKVVIEYSGDRDDQQVTSVELAVYVIATKNIQEGEQIFFDYNYSPEYLSAFGMLDLAPKKMCHNCLDNQGTTLRCSQCGIALYCNRECQKSDWPRHKQYCSPRRK